MKFRKKSKRSKPFNPATLLVIKQSLLGFALFSLIGILITAVWYGTRLESFTVLDIEAKGGETIAPASVVAEAKQALEGSYLGLVPKRFTFFYPTELVKEKVGKIPRIKDVTVSLTPDNNLLITYGEYKPDALWCKDADAAHCLFLDSTGYAFAAAPVLQGESLIRFYSLQQELAIGAVPFSEADYQRTKDFVKLLADSGWYTAKIEIDSARDVFYTLTPKSELKANLSQDPIELFNNLQTVRQSTEFAHLKPGNFQYIDLRFGTKVFVNEQLPATAALATTTTTSATTTEAEVAGTEAAVE